MTEHAAEPTRRTVIATSTAMGLGLSLFGEGSLAMSGGTGSVRPFHIEIPQAAIDDLLRRVSAARWADKEVVADQSQGAQLATLQSLARYWATGYDWRKIEAQLNALPNFVTEIDGLDIHFIHVRSKHANALPLVVTHGWPGSIIEQLGIIGPLTDPTAHGGSASDAFDVVIPSMPGYGFSARPTATGWNSGRIARAWDVLMTRLGYAHYVSQGGDWGARICEALAHQAPPGLLGVHTNLLLTLPPDIAHAIAAGDPPPAGMPPDEKSAYAQAKARTRGYYIEQATRPQTIGNGLADSPIALASWMIDHDPRSYGFIARAFDGSPVGALTRDTILDNITLYWLTNTATSAARLYWEEGKLAYSGPVSVPSAFTVFPDETFRAPRSWVERTFANLIYFHEADKGGHFAAWEQPQLFATEIRAAFRPLR